VLVRQVVALGLIPQVLGLVLKWQKNFGVSVLAVDRVIRRVCEKNRRKFI
jgi:hypothetical protein